MVRSRRKRLYLKIVRILRAWKIGIAFWKAPNPFRTECLIVRAILAVIFLIVVLPLLVQASSYGTISLVIYITALGYVNYGLKKLSES